MSLIDRRRPHAHVHRDYVTSTQEHRSGVENRCVVGGEEECCSPVVRDPLHSHGEGVSDKFRWSWCGIGDCHVVNGLFTRLNGVVICLGLGQGDFDQSGEHVYIAKGVGAPVADLVTLVRI